MFFGGLSIKKDEEVLKKNCPHVVVGTPGRILALVRNRSLNLKNVKHFVLDECDKMLEQLGECPRWVWGLWRPTQPHPPRPRSPPDVRARRVLTGQAGGFPEVGSRGWPALRSPVSDFRASSGVGRVTCCF